MTIHDLRKATAAFLAACLIVPNASVAARAAEAAGTPVTFQGAEAGEDAVTIKLSGPVQYNSFLTQTPPRLVMELLDTKHEGPNQSVKGQGKFLAGVRSSQFEKTPRLITRIVMDLVKMAGYRVEAVDAGLKVHLVGSVEDDSTASSAPAPAAAAPAPAARPVVKRPVRVAKAPAAAAAELVAETVASPAQAAAPAAPAPAPASQTAVEVVPISALAPAKPKVAPGAGAAFRRAGLDKHMSKELAAMAENLDASATTVELPDLPEDETSGSRPRGGRITRDIMSRMPRDPVTLDFDNTDVRDVIKLLAAKAKVNVIYGPDVSGSLTLHLNGVPFHEAFRTVLSMMGLTTDQVGENILRVITPAELTKQRTTSSAITRIFQLNYAKATEVKTTVDSVRGAEGRTGASTADVKTNSIIVTDTLEGLLATENLIAQLDQRPRQVLIEAKLVEVLANSGLNYGIQWDYLSAERGSVGGKQGQTLVGTLTTQNASAASTLNPIDQNANAVAGAGASGRGTGVALAADRVFGALTLGRITNNYFLSATLTAAASQGKAKVLSDPKIATLNNQPATINVTTQIPYVTSNVASTGVQTQTVSYVTTGIQMAVTPSINSDGRILLEINPRVSQPSVSASGSTLTGAPAVDSRDAKTTVLVRDGETIVIGGLINDSFQDTIAKIPLLGDIPILGWLFKKKTKTRVRNELLIFVTTRLMPE
ncbi:MAG: type IV pilus secretin PilQ [Elusimicrobiota bacterium]|nr:type IV pilus secretin PilQ [Elusimicrobiota bacterium]